MDICFDIYVANGQNKQTLPIYNFFWIVHSFPKTGTKKEAKKAVKKEPWTWKYII